LLFLRSKSSRAPNYEWPVPEDPPSVPRSSAAFVASYSNDQLEKVTGKKAEPVSKKQKSAASARYARYEDPSPVVVPVVVPYVSPPSYNPPSYKSDDSSSSSSSSDDDSSSSFDFGGGGGDFGGGGGSSDW
jgi:uncharacterized membrane protein YgcG